MPLYSTGCHNHGLINAGIYPAKRNISIQGPILDGPVPDWSSTRKPQAASSEEPDPEESGPGGSDSTSSPFPSLDYLARLPRPRLGSAPYGQVITSCTVPGTLALTFDDGPWRYTSDLLDLLERERIQATFFVCGSNIAEDQLTGYGHPHLLRRMITSGHQIGTHTWAHPDLAWLGRSEATRQMYLNERALVGVLGLLPTYFRPPYLAWSAGTLSVMAELGYHVITLDVDTRDWAGDYDAAKQNFLAALGWGYDSKLVLAHDIHKRTVYEFAEWMIDTAKERGYRLVTVGECLDDPMDNWYRSPYTGGSWQGSELLPTPDAPAHDKRAAYAGEGNNKGPLAPEDSRRTDTSDSARTATRSLWPKERMASLLLVSAILLIFL